ncbi:MAG: translation initiation factor IF-6 [Thermoplasmata archaeon]
MLKQLNILGNPYVGVLSKANNEFAIVPPGIPETTKEIIANALGIEQENVIQTTFGGSTIIGVLLCMNNNGAVVADFATNEELAPLRKKIRVERISDKYNACGNNILANDKAALINPDMSKETENIIKDVLGVEVFRGTIAGLKIVGTCAVANNKGVLCHPKANRDELKFIEEKFKVEAEIGTANYGTPYIGACVIANDKGAITGMNTTGIELGRINSGLGFL